MIYDSEDKTVKVQRFKYDLRVTQDKILESGLFRYLAERLAKGR